MFQISHETCTASFVLAYLTVKHNWVTVFLFACSGSPTCNRNVLVLVVKHGVHKRAGKMPAVWVDGRYESSARCDKAWGCCLQDCFQ